MKEIVLADDTLITSKTDLRGDIIYANDDFLKYAGYTMDEILYKPHSIVRHEDMPRTVFKCLWDYITKGHEIFAFVKNKAKSGDYYWVFANVTASFDEGGNIINYYSVRRKPNAKALEQIKPLYRELLKFEQMGLDRDVEFLRDFCKNSHKSYNELIFSLQEAK
ncbi:PAS domain-containing protein [Campylobacter upsaliensis]|uniref:PAS domain-containing protein n=1 Tax=Campylobacter upsaliensis TaxID=28080 RepID=UPI002149C3E0|nr:PAS domain-containing protein [Campylobacter upsaliensis]MCR2122496.1 PAS domain-containing protein [Campylobacter upsaliensis]